MAAIAAAGPWSWVVVVPSVARRVVVAVLVAVAVGVATGRRLRAVAVPAAGVAVRAGGDHAGEGERRDADADHPEGQPPRRSRLLAPSAMVRTISPRSATRTATAASAAASPSANWMLSDSSSPSTNEIPEVFAISQPTTAAPLMTMPASASMRPLRTSAIAPHPSWSSASTANAITAWRCSLWTPMAAAWMAPAPSDAAAPIASGE